MFDFLNCAFPKDELHHCGSIYTDSGNYIMEFPRNRPESNIPTMGLRNS